MNKTYIRQDNKIIRGDMKKYLSLSNAEKWLKHRNKQESKSIVDLLDNYIIYYKSGTGKVLPNLDLCKAHLELEKEYLKEDIYGAIWTKRGLKTVAIKTKKGWRLL